MSNKMCEYVVLTPLSPQISRIERCYAKDVGDVLHVAKGTHLGILVRKSAPPGEEKPRNDEDVSLSFLVWLLNKTTNVASREKRTLKFWFSEDCIHSDQLSRADPFHVAQELFKQLLKKDEFPKDYAGFIKKLLKLMQGGYLEIHRLEIEMMPATEVEETKSMPAQQHVYESSVWEHAEHGMSIDSSHIQEVLEHAYPAALPPETIAKNLKCTEEEVVMYLDHLAAQGVATRIEDKLWARTAHQVEKRVGPEVPPKSGKGKPPPTVAIITALYLEKLVVDSMLDNRETYVRYKTGGESNVYTLGNILGHRVVVTKLSSLDHTREARISAGSITTRLLGGFQSLEHVFIVGVGGGVPHYTDATRHVRLGDVVVSLANEGGTNKAPVLEDKPYAYAYCERLQRNRLTDAVEGYSVKTWSQDGIDIPNAAKDLQSETSDHLKQSLPPVWAPHVDAAVLELTTSAGNDGCPIFDRPPTSTDKLYMWVGGGGVVEVSHPEDRVHPRLHLGPVGSGRNVVREPQLRSDFAHTFGIRAYDDEFDMVVDSIFGNRIESWALIRGISDYVDGTRNRDWLAYAAMHAAAVTKELIGRLPKE